MNELEQVQYSKHVTTIKICLDVVLNKLSKKEDPEKIEKIVKGIEALVLKCYNLNPGKEKQNELIKMHEQNLSIFNLLNLAKVHGWEMMEFG